MKATRTASRILRLEAEINTELGLSEQKLLHTAPVFGTLVKAWLPIGHIHATYDWSLEPLSKPQDFYDCFTVNLQ